MSSRKKANASEAKNEEIRQLKDLFSLYDNDNSGSINKTELKLLMNSLGYYPSDELIQQMILENDVDGDELIDFEEFVQMAQRYKKEESMSPQNALRNAFQVLDKDHSRTLSNREFKAILTKVGDFPLNNDEVDEIYNALGLSENDEIPINDIIALFTQFE